VRFRPGPDPKLVVTLVQNRVALAKPVLPDAVQRGGIEVKLEAAKEGERNRAAIALEDRGSVDKDALQRFSATVLKRFSTEDAILKPVVFPGPAAPKLYVNVDRAKCLKLGVSLTAVFERLKAASSIAKIEDMKTLRVKSAKGDEIHLGKLATVTWKSTPPGVYRLDMYPAVRITGLPPEGKTPESAAARSAELAEEVRKNLDNPGSFAVVNLTER
jgi:multidrug efflux pump subunit AcrB